jgi:hypothetical protein
MEGRKIKRTKEKAEDKAQCTKEPLWKKKSKGEKQKLT